MRDQEKKTGRWKQWILIVLFSLPVLMVPAGLLRGQQQLPCGQAVFAQRMGIG